MEPIERFVTELRRQEKSPNTPQSYRYDLVLFARWLEGTNGEPLQADRITPTDLREYRAYLLTVEQRSPATIAIGATTVCATFEDSLSRPRMSTALLARLYPTEASKPVSTAWLALPGTVNRRRRSPSAPTANTWYSITVSVFPGSHTRVYMAGAGPDERTRRLAGARMDGVGVGVTVGVEGSVGVAVVVDVLVGVGVQVGEGTDAGSVCAGPPPAPNGTDCAAAVGDGVGVSAATATLGGGNSRWPRSGAYGLVTGWVGLPLNGFVAASAPVTTTKGVTVTGEVTIGLRGSFGAPPSPTLPTGGSRTLGMAVAVSANIACPVGVAAAVPVAAPAPSSPAASNTKGYQRLRAALAAPLCLPWIWHRSLPPGSRPIPHRQSLLKETVRSDMICHSLPIPASRILPSQP
jgi:hypothetical protein